MKARGLPEAGLDLWHVVEDEASQEKLGLPAGANNWYRRGVLLRRSNGGSPLDDNEALYTAAQTNIFLTWSDKQTVPIGIKLLDTTAGPAVTPPAQIRLQITR